MTRFGIVLGVQALVACCGPAAAATLEQEACARLKTELMQLELGGTRGSMAKGPEWAKVNLPADKLQQIKRLIEVEEQILFRCQGKPLVVLPEGVDGEAAAVTDRKEGVAATPAKEPPKALPPGKAQGPASGQALAPLLAKRLAKVRPKPPHRLTRRREALPPSHRPALRPVRPARPRLPSRRSPRPSPSQNPFPPPPRQNRKWMMPISPLRFPRGPTPSPPSPSPAAARGAGGASRRGVEAPGPQPQPRASA